MGLFEAKIVEELQHVRVIQNVFAHAANDVSFETKEISDACGLLKVPTAFHELNDAAALNDSRFSFGCSIFFLAAYLQEMRFAPLKARFTEKAYWETSDYYNGVLLAKPQTVVALLGSVNEERKTK